jgi:hypothetical protein
LTDLKAVDSKGAPLAEVRVVNQSKLAVKSNQILNFDGIHDNPKSTRDLGLKVERKAMDDPQAQGRFASSRKAMLVTKSLAVAPTINSVESGA